MIKMNPQNDKIPDNAIIDQYKVLLSKKSIYIAGVNF